MLTLVLVSLLVHFAVSQRNFQPFGNGISKRDKPEENIFGDVPDLFKEPEFKEAVGEGCQTRRLFCPEECELKYDTRGCPTNCNCKKQERCPRVRCPEPQPSCLILTKRDGCQTCGCRDPVVVISDEEGNEQIYFVRLTYQPPHNLTAIQSTLDKAKAIKAFNPNRGDHQRLVAEAISRSDGETTYIELNRRTYKIQTRPVFGAAAKRVTVPPPNADDDDFCAPFEKLRIDSTFAPVYKFLADNRNPSNNPTLVFPISYRHTQTQIRHTCMEYRKARSQMPSGTLQKCKTQHTKLGEAIAVLDYPCSSATQYGFRRYYECIRGAAGNQTMQQCQKIAKARLADPFLDPCDIYNILVECIHDPINYLCGAKAWEVEFQYLSVNVRQKFPSCRMETLGGQPRFVNRRRKSIIASAKKNVKSSSNNEAPKSKPAVNKTDVPAKVAPTKKQPTRAQSQSRVNKTTPNRSVNRKSSSSAKTPRTWNKPIIRRLNNSNNKTTNRNNASSRRSSKTVSHRATGRGSTTVTSDNSKGVRWYRRNGRKPSSKRD